MGLALSSSSKRVTGKLQESPEFISSIETVYNQTLSLSQQTFQGIPRYQIQSASDNLYNTLLQQHHIPPLIKKYVTAPPTHSQVQKSLRKVVDDEIVTTLGENEFKEFALDLYVGAIVSNAEKDIMVKVPMCVAGIVGVGVASRLGVQVVGTVVGVYAVGIATSVYLSLG